MIVGRIGKQNIHSYLDILTNEKFQNKDEVVYIGDDFSWQSIANETCIKWLDKHGVDWNFRLDLTLSV
jgi:hypothetical protein